MPPGRRTNRCTLPSEQEIPMTDTSASAVEREFIDGSAGKIPQVSRRTTRSSVHSQQRPTVHIQQGGSIAQSILPGEHVEPPSTARTEAKKHQASNVHIEEPNGTMSSQAIDQNVRHNPRKATRGMTTSKMARAASTGKLSVTFDANCRKPICTNAERFNNEIGFIVHNHGTFNYKDWRLVPEHVRAPMRNYLQENFDIDLHDETTKLCIDEQMKKAWKNYKYKLHSYFKDIGGKTDLVMAKKKRHPDLTDNQQEEWEMLCDHWSSTRFQERASKNTINQSKKTWYSKNGSVSTVRHHIRRGMELTSSTGQIETWRQNHFGENGWTGPELEKFYEDMMNLREAYSPEELSDKEIMEMVLGRQSVYLRGWGRSARSKVAKSSHETTTQTSQPTYQEIFEELKETKDLLTEVVDVLRKNNLMPQSMKSPTNEVSDAHMENLE